MKQPPAYFERIRAGAAARWDQLEADPDLAGPWHQLFKQVQSPRHVLSELLQNADDAGATEAAVEIRNGEFCFSHNGEDFVEEHFASLCRFGYSNKRALHTIGFRGIGFKSTFSLGDEVRLMTPTLSVAFHRDRFTQPHWCPEAKAQSRTTVRVEIEDGRRETELQKNFDEWVRSPASLLFFQHIRRLRIGEQEVHWEFHDQGPVTDSRWMRLSSKPDRPYLLIRSPAEDFPHDCLEEIQKERMVRPDEESSLPPCRVELVLGMEGRLFVILPTGVEASLPFACNAPFVQDPARVKIKDPEISPTNRWLLARVGNLAAEAMLRWVGQLNKTVSDRAKAYELFLSRPKDENSIEDSVLRSVSTAFQTRLKDAHFLLTEAEGLVRAGQCCAVSRSLLRTWPADQLAAYFMNDGESVLSRHISAAAVRKMLGWQYFKQLTVEHVIDVLESKHLSRPPTCASLLSLWIYLVEEKAHRRFHYRLRGLRIFPVIGDPFLYSSSQVIRAEENKILGNEEQWRFLRRFLLVIDREWLDYLADQNLQALQSSDNLRNRHIAEAFEFIEKLGLDVAADYPKMISRVSSLFFTQQTHPRSDYVRLAQLTAALGVTTPPGFQFVTKNGQPVDKRECVIADLNHDMDEFVDEAWYSSHVLHDDYYRAEFCSEQQWRYWINSGMSGLMQFVPLVRISRRFSYEHQITPILKERGYEEEPVFPYRNGRLSIEDWSFHQDHWKRWEGVAARDPGIWARVIRKIFDQPKSYWEKAANAQAVQWGSKHTKPVTPNRLIPEWVIRFRELECLPDTRGKLHRPADLMRRTPLTEALIEVEPFVEAALDTEATRPLLEMLGVRDTASSPDMLINRIKTLAAIEKPLIYELEKWYHRLDQVLISASTDDLQNARMTFANERLIPTDAHQWATAAEVFIAADDNDVPEAALVHPAVRHLSVWASLGVADRPTADLAIRWLSGLQSRVSLTADEVRRVRAMLGRYPERVWHECRHWLTLESEWVPTEELEFSATSATVASVRHLFKTFRSRTADFQKLTPEICGIPPFVNLVSLAQVVEDHIEDRLFDLPKPVSVPWLTELGDCMSRITLDDENETVRIRQLGQRLARTQWQECSGLRTIPYIHNTPAGTPRDVPVLWKDALLYVEKQSRGRIAKMVSEELNRIFNMPEVAAAIFMCYERAASFVREYLRENFSLLPEGSADSGQGCLHSDGDRLAATEPVGSDGLADKWPSDVPVADAGDGLGLADRLPHELSVVNARAEAASSLPGRRPVTDKPSLMERFAHRLGFRRDGFERYIHDNGSYIQKVNESQEFRWMQWSADGDLIQAYCEKEQYILGQPIEIDSDVWNLFLHLPDTHTLLLTDTDGNPVDLGGRKLVQMSDRGLLRLYPAKYRLVWYVGHEDDKRKMR